MIMTARTSFPATYIFSFLSNLMPAYYFSKYDFFRADGCPEEIAVKREAAFNGMQEQWDSKWPKSIEFGHSLRAVFSDLRFAAGNRVFLPFRKVLDGWCDPFTIATHTDRMNLIDVDGHEQLDISGSYGTCTLACNLGTFPCDLPFALPCIRWAVLPSSGSSLSYAD